MSFSYGESLWRGNQDKASFAYDFIPLTSARHPTGGRGVGVEGNGEYLFYTDEFRKGQATGVDIAIGVGMLMYAPEAWDKAWDAIVVVLTAVGALQVSQTSDRPIPYVYDGSLMNRLRWEAGAYSTCGW